MSDVDVRPATPADAGWIAARLERLWGATVVVRRGEAVEATGLPAFVAWRGGERVGLVSLAVRGPSCEVVSIDADVPGEGIGTALLHAAADAARAAGCARLWLVTTNDNLRALRFYQRRGLRLAALHAGAVDEARRRKPSIPREGQQGIPIRDELELELELGPPAAAPEAVAAPEPTAAPTTRHFAVTRVRGPAWDPRRPMREQDGWAGHAAFMDDLAATGFIALGGPLGDGERVLLACSAPDEDAVRARLALDPWSAAGLLEIERVEPWEILLRGG